MTTARRDIVDRENPGFYHCMSRCVRQARLLGGEGNHRRAWIRSRLQKLVEIFAIDAAGYAVLDNHLHVLLRTAPQRARDWSPREVAERWSRLYPKSVMRWTGTRSNGLDPDEGVPASAIDALAAKPKRISTLRDRLADLSWFMKCLKEPLSRMANREDGCKGTFWDRRFKSPRILDEAALITCMAYVDLNLIRAGVATTPEQSDYTSVQDRIHVRERFEKMKGTRKRSSQRATTLPTSSTGQVRSPRSSEDGVWLAPIGGRGKGPREALLSISLDEYLLVLDATGRSTRKATQGTIPEAARPILERLKLDTDEWAKAMANTGRLFGTVAGAATTRATEALRRGAHWVVGSFNRVNADG
jgi:REP element-mobilizing transposase RayT